MLIFLEIGTILNYLMIEHATFDGTSALYRLDTFSFDNNYCRFNTIDHFLVSVILYDTAINQNVADLMRTSRAAYHYALRSVGKNESDIVRQRFVDAVLRNNNRVFWKETKKITNRNCSTTGVVGGHIDSTNTAHLFAVL